MKQCRYCARDLALTEFTVRSASPDGLSYKCRSCQKAYSAEHYRATADAAKARAKAWARSNPDKRRQIAQASATKNRAHKTAYMRRWREANPEKSSLANRLNQHRRRAAGAVDARAVDLIVQSARGCCVYCGNAAPLTLDHVAPVISGGGNEWDNLLPACRPCNSSKNHRPVADWLFERHGVEGLARAIFAMRNVRKIIARLHPEALYGFPIREV